MKILIVEDSPVKAKEVEATLRRGVQANGLKIETATSFITATRKLQTETFDLLVLDLVLPIRDGEPPVNHGGKQVLSEILTGTECRHPSHIICLTAFEEISGIVKDEVEKSLLHLVIYSETDTKWRDVLSAKAEYVAQRLEDADRFPNDFQTDIAIVTSSPHVELTEVLKLPGAFVGEYHQTDALYYYSASWKRADEKSLSAVACAAPSMGMTAACATALKVIERWRPKFLVMTGIAAGTKREQKYGDVLLAESAYDYGSGKILEKEDGTRAFLPSPNQLRIDQDLQAILQRWEREQLRMEQVRKSWYTTSSAIPKVITGVFATGAAVVQSQDLVDEILNSSRKVVGLEMEAYGVFHAAHLARNPRPRVLVAKSVSDFADAKKKDKWQQYAAFTSARFVYEFFTNAVELPF